MTGRPRPFDHEDPPPRRRHRASDVTFGEPASVGLRDDAGASPSRGRVATAERDLDPPETDAGDGDGDDYVELPPESGWARKIGGFTLVVLLLLVGTIGAGAYWFDRQIAPPGGPGAGVEVEVPEGASTGDIAAILEEEGVITNATVFSLYVRAKSAGPFQAGSFTIPENAPMGDVVTTLAAGPSAPPFSRVTIPEGFTLREITAALAEGVERFDPATIEQVVTDGTIRSQYQPPESTNLEGLLFPGTYRVEDDEDPAAVVGRMVATMDATLTELDVTSAQERFNLTPYEIVIVASLIEQETLIDSERPMVARVIYNRLADGMPLGIDATSRYEAVLEGGDRDDIDFDSDSPYNTRTQVGLPPTPIAAPGRASIEGALNPADGDWLYYVLADQEGNHVFTESYDEFLVAKDACAEADLGCG